MEGDQEEGMGEPVLSLDGWWDSVEATAEEQAAAAAAARLEMKRSVAQDVEYWERISSACMLEDAPPPERLAVVQDEFKEYATLWVRQGKDLGLIPDFKAHLTIRDDRFARRQEAKAKKQRAEAAKLASLLTVPSHELPTPAAGRGRGGGGGGRGGWSAYSYGSSAPPAAQADLYLPIEVTISYNIHEALAAASRVSERLRSIADHICTDLPEVTKEERELLAAAYSHMMEKFREPRLKRLYGYNATDHQTPPLKFGSDVPSYFANVSDGSIYRRKLLSIAGLRNLIIYGPIIYHQLHESHFSGDPSVYKGDTGLSLMRRVTGNVVDLDSTVLRCSDRATLNAINASNKHKREPVYANTEEFAKSKQAQEIAVHCSLPMLAAFAKELQLSDAQQMARKIHSSQVVTPAPVAGNNTDRGKYPVWQYVNAGQNSFHANVPTMEDVNGALLKAPYHCIQLWLLMHAISDGAALEARVDDFFENCIVDSCFNMKWKAIEEFGGKMAHEGTIVYVLQRVQAASQAVFTMEFFEADNENQDKEVAAMVDLAKGLSGRDKTGAIRLITEADVARWVRDPSVDL